MDHKYQQTMLSFKYILFYIFEKKVSKIEILRKNWNLEK